MRRSASRITGCRTSSDLPLRPAAEQGRELHGEALGVRGGDQLLGAGLAVGSLCRPLGKDIS